MNDGPSLFVRCIIIVFVSLANFFYGVATGKDKIRKQAIDKGCAEYVTNPETLEAEFKWKTNKQDTD